jgi:hypothetical protein
MHYAIDISFMVLMVILIVVSVIEILGRRKPRP